MVWIKIEEFPRYSVHSSGLVRNDESGKLMGLTRLKTGHTQVGFFYEGAQYTRGVARLVAEAFVHNPNPRRDNTPIHLNGNLSDCNARNLQWRPRWFALKHTRQFRVRTVFESSPVRDRRTGQVYNNVWDVIVERGLLHIDVIRSIEYKTYVFPTMDVFEWA